MNHTLKILPILFTISVSACRYGEIPDSSHILGSPVEYEGTLVDASNPWFSDLGEFLHQPVTKSSASESGLQPLSSLLDPDGKVTKAIGGRTYTQTPFLSNAQPQYFCLSDALFKQSAVSADSILVSRKFLMESEDESGNGMAYVVNILARYGYCLDFGYDELSFLCRPAFSGIIIFSDPDGTYNYVSFYEDGEMRRAEFLPASGGAIPGAEYLVAVTPEATKGGWCEIIDTPAECTAHVTAGSAVTVYVYDGHMYSGKEAESPTEGKDGGGGGGEGSDSEQKEMIAELIEKWSNLAVKAKEKKVHLLSEDNKRKVTALMTEIIWEAVSDKVAGNWDLPYYILSKIDQSKISIMIDDTATVILSESGDSIGKITFNTHLVSRGKNYHTYQSSTVTLNIDLLDNQYSCLHEFFHVLQYSSNESNWQKGDYEFEAAIFNALMIKYGYALYLDYNYEAPLLEYYNNPNDSTYKAALEAYKECYTYYDNVNFPISPELDYKERIKHLNRYE